MKTLIKRLWQWIQKQFGMTPRERVIQAICVILLILWLYAPLSKLADYEETRRQMLNQVFPAWMAEILAWLVPVTELALVPAMLFKPVQLPGLKASLVLLIAFSIYIALAMSGAFGRIPCSCGGIIRDMGYWTHLLFNLFFAALSAIAIVLISKGRRSARVSGGKEAAVATMQT